MTQGGTAAWWRGGDALSRVLADLMRAEIIRQRPGSPPPPQAWTPDTRLDEAGLGLDSLERLNLAAAVSELLHMHRSGLGDDLRERILFSEWVAGVAASLDRFSTEMTFRTSGSTGRPKRCVHALAALEQEARGHAVLLAGVARVLTAVPAHHLYGFLFTVLVPFLLGSLPVLDVRACSPGAVVGLARAGDVIVGFPDVWGALGRAASSGWPEGVTGVTSTAPCPPETAHALKQAGLGRLLEVHGSSDTAGLGWRDDSAAPFALLPMWERHGDGLVAAGAAVVEPPDLMDWVGPRHYRLIGRRDGAVQVAGVNVFPERVAEVLRRHRDVAAVAVRPMNPEEGGRLKAFIVPEATDANHDRLRQSVADFAAEYLSPPEQPRAYAFGSALPRNALGKAADWPVSSPAG